MKPLQSTVQMISGTAQFRIKEVHSAHSRTYIFYSQAELESDLAGISNSMKTFSESKATKKTAQVDPNDKMIQLVYTNDVIFSLISGRAALVSSEHNEYLFTQNYLKLIPDPKLIDKSYLIYLLNEDKHIQKQLHIGLQGSIVLKYTVKQVSELVLPNLPSIEKQQQIGESYLNALRLKGLRQEIAQLELKLMLQQIEKANKV